MGLPIGLDDGMAFKNGGTDAETMDGSRHVSKKVIH